MRKTKMAPVEIDNAYIVNLHNDGLGTEEIARIFHKQKAANNQELTLDAAKRTVEDILLREKRRKE